MELPHEPFERRKALLFHGIDERVDLAIVRFQKQHGKGSFYEACHTFVFHDLYDAPRSDFNSLRRVGFFPWLEIQRELGEAINHALLASYKATFDNYRRALELAIAGAYFLQAHISEDDAKRWLRSERETPLMTRALSELVQASRFRHVDAQSSWSSHLKAFYWRLCDIVHVRGEKASFGSIQPSHAHFCDVSLPEFSAQSLDVAVNTFIETTRHIATVVAIENPILLVGLDMFQKFGMNPPLSGFFDLVQSGRLHKLVLPEVAPSLRRLQQEDDEIISVTAWFDSLPDISDEEIDRQVKEQEEWVKSMQGKEQREQ